MVYQLQSLPYSNNKKKNTQVSFNFRGINIWLAHSVIFIISSYKAIFIPEAFYEIN